MMETGAAAKCPQAPAHSHKSPDAESTNFLCTAAPRADKTLARVHAHARGRTHAHARAPPKTNHDGRLVVDVRWRVRRWHVAPARTAVAFVVGWSVELAVLRGRTHAGRGCNQAPQGRR